jgi:hypothetical protein
MVVLEVLRKRKLRMTMMIGIRSGILYGMA